MQDNKPVNHNKESTTKSMTIPKFICVSDRLRNVEFIVWLNLIKNLHLVIVEMVVEVYVCVCAICWCSHCYFYWHLLFSMSMLIFFFAFRRCFCHCCWYYCCFSWCSHTMVLLVFWGFFCFFFVFGVVSILVVLLLLFHDNYFVLLFVYFCNEMFVSVLNVAQLKCRCCFQTNSYLFVYTLASADTQSESIRWHLVRVGLWILDRLWNTDDTQIDYGR